MAAASGGLIDFSIIGGWIRLLLFWAIIALVVLFFALNPLAKWGLETVLKKATQAQVTVAEVSINPFAGTIDLHNFTLFNPLGYTNAPAIYLPRVSVVLLPKTLFTGHVQVRDITIEGPELLFEGGLKNNNLQTLKQNALDYAHAHLPEAPTVSDDPNATPPQPRRYTIDRVMITNPTLRLSTNIVDKQVSVQLQDIVIKDIGKGAGLNSAEVTAAITKPLLQIMHNAAGRHLGGLADKVGAAARELGQKVGNFFKGE